MLVRGAQLPGSYTKYSTHTHTHAHAHTHTPYQQNWPARPMQVKVTLSIAGAVRGTGTSYWPPPGGPPSGNERGQECGCGGGGGEGERGGHIEVQGWSCCMERCLEGVSTSYRTNHLQKMTWLLLGQDFCWVLMDLFSEVLNKGVDGVRKKSGGKTLIHK